MHRLSCVILGCLTILSSAVAQTGWEKIFDKGHAQCFLSFGDVILVGSDSGCYRSLDRGLTWMYGPVDSIFTPLQGKINAGVASLSRNSQYIFAATNLSVYSSQDTGRTWKSLGPAPEGKLLYMIKVYANEEIVLTTMAGGGLFRSTDNGATWFFLGPYRQYDYITHGNAMFAGAMDGIWCSTDQALTWTQCSGFPVYKQAVHLANSDTYFFADAFDKLYRSEDLGANWYVLNSDLPIENRHLEGVFVTGTYVFTGLSDNTIYLSQDDGDHWSDISDGLDTNHLDGPYGQFGRNGNRVFTNKNGCLWSYDVRQIASKARASETAVEIFELKQNYPNPFNPTTMIRYQLSSANHVSLNVYDALGREVATLVNEVKEAGYHSVTFSAVGGSASGGDATTLASGIYITRLQSGGKVQLKKMILIK